MDFTLYGDDTKGLIKLDPRTKLLIVLASSFLSLRSFHLGMLLVLGTILCGILALSGKPFTALKCYLVFGAGCYLKYVFWGTERNTGFDYSIFSGVITIFLFTFPVIVSFLLLIQTTRISQFLTAFEAMHMPAQVVIPVAVFFRFIPAVQEEWRGIRKAMAFRGIDLSLISMVRSPLRSLEYALIPLLFSSVAVMEELAAAAMARGMDSEAKRSSLDTVKLRVADYIVLAIFTVMIVMTTIVGKQGL